MHIIIQISEIVKLFFKFFSKIGLFGARNFSKFCIIRCVPAKTACGGNITIPYCRYNTLYFACSAHKKGVCTRQNVTARGRGQKMANKPIEALIKCPFYVKLTEDTVTCEGYIQNTCMITRFRNSEQKKAHMQENCFLENGGSCFMAKSLYRKYDDE